MNKSARSGFSLLEMVIVVIIIGLVAAAITIGMQLKRGAEMQKLLAEIDRYRGAINMFKTKFEGLPGDFPNAESFWGVDPGGCPPASNDVPKTATCDGDGNGVMDTAEERFRSWQQLANAGMIEGSFTGADAPGANIWMPGMNAPPSMDGTGFAMGWMAAGSNVTSPNDYFEAGSKTFMEPGVGALVGGDMHHGIMSPSEVLDIDSKIDDGFPGQGNVQGRPKSSSFNPDCSTTDNATTARYDTSNDVPRCGFMYMWVP